MPKGTPLDPQIVEGIGELYAQQGNLSGVARALNLPFSTVRDVIARGSNARRRQLLDEALALGMEEGAEHLRECALKVRDALIDNAKAGEGLSSSDVRNLCQSLAALVGAEARVKDSLTRARNGARARQRARLEMDRTRLEIADLQAEAAKRGRGAGRRIFSPDDPEWGELQREAYGAARQGMSSGRRERDATAQRDPADVAEGELPQVPNQVGTGRR